MLNFLIVFLLIFNSNFSKCSASLQPIQNTRSNLTKFICDAADEISRHEIETIAIVKLRNNFSSRIVDELHKCMPKSVAMVQFDQAQLAVKSVRLEAIKFVVMIGDDVELVKLYRTIRRQTLSHMAKFLFVTSKRKPSGLSEILSKNGFLNFASVFEHRNGEISVEVSNHFANTSEILKNVSKHEIIPKLYPDKLKNMHHKPLRVGAYTGMPDVLVRGGKVISCFKYLVELFCEKTNATLEIKIVTIKGLTNILNELLRLFSNRNIDMTLSMIPITLSTRKLVSYAENAVCALIPSKQSSKVDVLAVFKPWDLGGNASNAAVTISFMILWRIYRRRGEAVGSAWNVVLGFHATFTGQQFNFRVSNPTMKFALLIAIFGFFVMKNIYEASITSQITIPYEYDKIDSFAELFNIQNYFKIGNQAHENMFGVPEYQRAYNSGRVTIEKGKTITDSHLIQIYKCQALEKFLKQSINKSYYIFQERLISSNTLHEMGIYNPYTEYFQTLITRAYSAGLDKAWDGFYELETTNITDTKEPERKLSLLNFKDLISLMHVLPFGLTIAALVLLIEIFHHECWTRFSWQNSLRKWAWKKEKRMMKVRRIQVRPINEAQDETGM